LDPFGSIWILELGQGIVLVRILFEEGPCKLCTLGVGCLAMCIMCSEFEASERSERSERACHVFQSAFMYIIRTFNVTTCHNVFHISGRFQRSGGQTSPHPCRPGQVTVSRCLQSMMSMGLSEGFSVGLLGLLVRSWSIS
jgi:hypothetical protein